MRFSILPTLCLVLTASACGDDPASPETNGDFIVRASGSATASVSGASLLAQAGVDPTEFSIGFLEMRLSASVDCSAPYQTVFAQSSPNRVDLLTDPEIANTDGVAEGTYPCVLMRISDLLQFVPSATTGACTGGVAVTRDTYRAETDSPYLDPDLGPIAATGSIPAPGEDFVWVFLSTNEAAAEARGFSEHQVIPLTSSLVSPGTSTFYWDLSGAIGPEGSECGTIGGSIGFR